MDPRAKLRAVLEQTAGGYAVVDPADVLAVAALVPAPDDTVSALVKGARGAGRAPEVQQVADHLRHLLALAAG